MPRTADEVCERGQSSGRLRLLDKRMLAERKDGVPVQS